MSSILPDLGSLRAATPSDALRTGIIVTSCFKTSPVNVWMRPHHEKYPDDTLHSYQQTMLDMIKDPQCLVLVALDKYNPEESKKSDAIIPSDSGFDLPSPGEEVVVGIACWKLQPGSPLVGVSKNETDLYPDIPPSQKRDQNLDRLAQYKELSGAAEQKYFHGFSTMEVVAIHPAYWGRGHGSSLVKWGMHLAELDHTKQGVVATQLGAKLYARLGFSTLSYLRVDRDDQDREELALFVMQYDPEKTKEDGLAS